MEQFDTVTAETSVDSKEMRELIARLTDPTRAVPTDSVQVKDIAETLEIPETEVVRELERLRESKRVKPVPDQAEKLANVLDSMKSTDYQPITNRPLRRITATGIIALTMMLALLAFMLFSLMQVAPIAPPRVAQPEPAHKVEAVAPKAP